MAIIMLTEIYSNEDAKKTHRIASTTTRTYTNKMIIMEKKIEIAGSASGRASAMSNVSSFHIFIRRALFRHSFALRSPLRCSPFLSCSCSLLANQTKHLRRHTNHFFLAADAILLPKYPVLLFSEMIIKQQ